MRVFKVVSFKNKHARTIHDGGHRHVMRVPIVSFAE